MPCANGCFVEMEINDWIRSHGTVADCEVCGVTGVPTVSVEAVVGEVDNWILGHFCTELDGYPGHAAEDIDNAESLEQVIEGLVALDTGNLPDRLYELSQLNRDTGYLPNVRE